MFSREREYWICARSAFTISESAGISSRVERVFMASGMRSFRRSQRGDSGRNWIPVRTVKAKMAWKAIGRRQFIDEVLAK